ncbi:MAG: hypothetical protein HN341_09540 [Verrucomicrobia bacterium]|jgi:hypothetical protein|nr:hypothetical protein [Verrucomicrobiota bacterium]
MTFSQNDTNVLRDLATRCREIADSEQNLVLKQRWTDLNDLKHSGPPLLLTSPEGAWREIIPTFPVECEGQQARGWECALRKRIYQHDVIKDDAAFDPVFTVGRAVSVGDYGIPFSQSRSEEAQGAYHDEPVLTNLDSDLDKLHFRTLTVDREKSEATFELAAQTLGDLLEIQYPATYWWTCGLTWQAIKLWGLENLMISMYDNSEGLHRLMKFLSDEMLNFITFFEREELLGYNANGGVGSGGLGFTTQLPSRDRPTEGPVRLDQIWGFAESQETVGVSPEMFGEFIYPYQKPLQQKFGLNYYGCCEASEGRWKSVSQTPNLRSISVSPWSDQAACADLFGRDYVYCRKPNPSPVCINFNEDEICNEFKETLTHAGELNTVMILKDTHTVENQPERFAKWVTLGRRALDG